MAKKKSKKKTGRRFPTYDDDRAKKQTPKEVLSPANSPKDQKIIDELESREHSCVIPACSYCGKEPTDPCKCYEFAGKGITPDLYKRCRERIGLTDVQIGRYPDAESLLQYANGIHPASNTDARVKEGERPEPVMFEEYMPDRFTLESVLEAKFIKTNREHFDRGNLQGLLRRINRRYGQHDPVRIVTDQSFKVVKRELVTKFTIYYKE